MQSLDYAAASRTSLLLLIVSFVILASVYSLQRVGMAEAASLNVAVAQRFGGTFAIDAELEVELRPVSVLVLFGPSGAGKTTVLRYIAGLARPDTGVIRFGGELWCDTARDSWRPPQQRHIGLVFQEPKLFPHLTVRDNICTGQIQIRPGSDPGGRNCHNAGDRGSR